MAELKKTLITLENPEEALTAQDVTDIKTELELQNVDNTSDADKPVSTAQQTALDLKQDLRVKKSIAAATYTILVTDIDKFLEFSAACVVTIPNGLDTDLEFQGEQIGAGEVSFIAEAGGTLNQFSDFQNATAGQYSVFGIRTKGSDVATLFGTLKLV